MRALLVLVAACGAYDPIAEVPHGSRELPTTQAAIEAILADNPTPRVYAIGEYHQTHKAIAKTSPLARFTQEIIGLLEPHARHLVVEAWLDASCDPKLQKDLDKLTDRPNTTQMEILRLVRRSQQMHVEAHGLPMTCIEHSAVLNEKHGVNILLLLELITEKLHETTRQMLDADPDHSVIVYGGALHNDLYPRWPLDDLSYAKPLAQELGGTGGVLEIDLVVPEVVADMQMIREEPWFPLLGRAAPERVIVWERGPSSYVLILPAQSTAVARVALPVDVM